MPHARATDESTPFACVAAEAGLLKSLSLTLLGFFTSNRLEHAAAPASFTNAFTGGGPATAGCGNIAHSALA